jgi:hypothetical protein
MTNPEEPTAMPAITTTVAAEDAPLGVQLWPTLSPEFAPQFTLDEVATVRTVNGTYVRWTYQDGKTRQFRVGEQVMVSLAPPPAATPDANGWAWEAGLVEGSRHYTHPRYPGWMIYSAGSRQHFTVYCDGLDAPGEFLFLGEAEKYVVQEAARLVEQGYGPQDLAAGESAAPNAWV